ncbi:MAG: hypothetical protein GX442_13965 [Candidatus Riflebacteria bacterium]|nr:hypothetical protein [Candidatus Riflebacteria bacterium]
MSMKFSSFDALTPSQRIAALMHVKEAPARRKEDFLLALHGLLDADQQVRMTAKLVAGLFAKEPYFVDLKGLTPEEMKKRIEATFGEMKGGGPDLVEYQGGGAVQEMVKNLQAKSKKAEMTAEWDGPFPKTVGLLNALREDTVAMITQILEAGETVEWACPGFYLEALKPFREGQRSLDHPVATTLVNLNHVHDKSRFPPALLAMWEMLERPTYLLVILTNRRLVLFLRDQVKESRAAWHAMPYDQITKVTSTQAAGTVSLDIETAHDFLLLPQLFPADGLALDKTLREKSISAITSSEDLLDRDFDKELAKLEMLFKGKAIPSNEYLFRKMRLQKMELEKFSDANLEALLAKRFSDETGGKKFDAQILQKFTSEKTVMFTDIAGYSKKAAQKQLLDTMTLLAIHDKMLLPILNEHAGKLIKKIGDALMVKFDDAGAACRCGAAMQARLIAFNRTSPEKILIRIGINTGTVFTKGDDVFGDAVNVAARMESLARPGMIFLTESTHRKLAGALPTRYFGKRAVKGQAIPLEVYALVDETAGDREMIEQGREFRLEMGIDDGPEEDLLAPADAPGETLPPLEMPVAGGFPAASAEPAAPPTIDGETIAVLTAVEAAIGHYKAAVRLGAPRDGALEAWFNSFPGRLSGDA